jgi:tRNA N6-adenosine threonylcarbamoyltransferase
MIILGIDTSCDDTSAAVVEDGRRALSNVVQSQVKLHHPYGGVVPELASREHIKNISPVVDAALSHAGMQWKDLDGIAATVGPGLVGSLLVGLYFAKALAYAQGLPLVAVNHLEGHILSIFLEDEVPGFPFVSMTVSGGHTSLYHVMGYGRYALLGQTLDDAAGEAFDKVAKLLGLGYPGGAVIERTAVGGARDRIRFPKAYLSSDSLDFSFSGVKTAVALYMKRWYSNEGARSEATLSDVAASFQESVVSVLCDKLLKAAEITGVSTLVVAGGVACNGRLRARLEEVASERRIRIFFPRPVYCTDNGAMIAAAAFHRLMAGQRAEMSVDARSKFPIQDLPEVRTAAI